MSTTSFDGLINGATGTFSDAYALATKDTSGMTAEQKMKHSFEMQVQMMVASSNITASSEVIKSWGEAQKGVAKNMSV
jgi:hypothetical protein